MTRSTQTCENDMEHSLDHLNMLKVQTLDQQELQNKHSIQKQSGDGASNLKGEYIEDRALNANRELQEAM